MRKISLDFHALRVESFATSREKAPHAGTVRGHEDSLTPPNVQVPTYVPSQQSCELATGCTEGYDGGCGSVSCLGTCTYPCDSYESLFSCPGFC